VKGIGESGTVPAAAAIISGVEDALSDYDLRIDEVPISPARILELIWASKASAKNTGPSEGHSRDRPNGHLNV
jgi:carbon-monoxide dehydrogenase large subunit